MNDVPLCNNAFAQLIHSAGSERRVQGHTEAKTVQTQPSITVLAAKVKCPAQLYLCLQSWRLKKEDGH